MPFVFLFKHTDFVHKNNNRFNFRAFLLYPNSNLCIKYQNDRFCSNIMAFIAGSFSQNGCFLSFFLYIFAK